MHYVLQGQYVLISDIVLCSLTPVSGALVLYYRAERVHHVYGDISRCILYSVARRGSLLLLTVYLTLWRGRYIIHCSHVKVKRKNKKPPQKSGNRDKKRPGHSTDAPFRPFCPPFHNCCELGGHQGPSLPHSQYSVSSHAGVTLSSIVRVNTTQMNPRVAENGNYPVNFK